MSHHSERLQAELKRLAAEFLNRASDGKSLITVTTVELSPSGQRATILLSILPETMEDVALAFAQRQLRELVSFVQANLRVCHLPKMNLALDLGEKHRQKIDKLLQ